MFDPPPDALIIHWLYLAAVTVLATLGLAAAAAIRQAHRSPISILREL
ncbi:MAG: hypothetical protein ACRDQI_09015 [Pseudonocardiaceae bacterium]